MNRFTYSRPISIAVALHEGTDPSAHFIAGGTNLIDLMKYDVERPARLIDISRLPELNRIEPTPSGGLRIGALVTNSQAAEAPEILAQYPMLASALLAGASPQLRNAATIGGNLLQRTRCYYFYDAATPCNKRQPGAGCSALQGVNRIHAILGASVHCIATHPSDMCIALAALEASVHVIGPDGVRVIPIGDFHRLPGSQPQRDTTVRQGELITAVELPGNRLNEQAFTGHGTYLKLRDRHSYAFALVSVAAALDLDGDRVRAARIALGGVAHKPWRVPAAEALLVGRPASEPAFRDCAARLLEGAVGYGGNDFKISLAHDAIIRALTQAAAGERQSLTDKRIA